VNGHITHMEVDMVDQNLKPVPINRLMLHHIVFLNINVLDDRTCENTGYAGFGEEVIAPKKFAPERFYAAGEERAKISFPPGYGYTLKTNHDWSLVYMLMNHKPVTDDKAWVEYKLTVDTDMVANHVEPVRPYWLDAANCRADPIYNVPGMHPKARKRAARKVGGVRRIRRFHTRSRDFTIKEDGWIVGGAGHVHGGAVKLTITKPYCNDLRVAQSVPTWGKTDHEFYKVRPVLHEPGPIGMSAFSTSKGIPVRENQKIRLNSIYDNVRPHTRVMGIFVVYLAENQNPDLGAVPPLCGGAPSGPPPEGTTYGPGTNLEGRPGPIWYTIPLTGLDANKNAVTIKKPPGPIRRLRSGATVTVGDSGGGFNRPNIRLRRGATLNYKFSSVQLHNLTLANGPLGIGSPNLDGNRSFSQRFTRAGTYNMFCALHPVQMSQRVIVKNKRKHRRNRRR
jgi:plastocyanin